MSHNTKHKIQNITYAFLIVGVVVAAIFVLYSSKKTLLGDKSSNDNQGVPIQKDEYIGLKVAPIQSDKTKIDFPYTDDNKDETLIIKTDKGVYNNFSGSDVYVSITNTAKNNEKAVLVFYFADESKALSKNIIDPNLKTLAQKLGDKWEYVDFFKNNIKLNEKLLGTALSKRQSIPNNYKAKAATQVEIAAGETIYFRSKIAFAPGSKGEFWVEAVGAGGGYGLLDPWYNSSWSYRRKISIDHTKVGGTLANYLNNFPVLVSITNSDLRHTSFGGKVTSASKGFTGGGGDFVFTASRSATALNYEIEQYASSSGTLLAWVKVASVSAIKDTDLYMYYGGPSSGPTNQNKTGTWSNNYAGVWHMPNGTTLTADDSTSNRNDGTLVAAPAAVAGQIDGAADFGVANNTKSITLADSTSLNITGAITMSAWIKIPNGSDRVIFGGYNATTPFAGYGFGVDIGPTQHALAYWSSAAGSWVSANTVVDDDTLRYVAVSVNGSNASFYVNGVADGSPATSNPGSYAGQRDIGRSEDNLNFINGTIDEMHVANTNRSVDWIKTEYNNQSSPNGFYALGGAEVISRTVPDVKIGNNSASDVSSKWYSSGSNNWSYRRKFSINHTKVGGTTYLNNFPVLISITNPDLRHTSFGGKVTSASKGFTGGGGDFVFTASNSATALKYEIEQYASSSGTLLAWVKVASVSATKDTDLYMYYGGPSSGPTNQSVTATWDDNYVSVYHLSDNAANTTVVESKATNTGTAAANTSTKTTTGYIAKGLTFNNSSDKVTLGTSNLATGNGATWTLEAWVNTNLDDNNHHIAVSYGNGGTDGASAFIAEADLSNWTVQTWGCPANCVRGSTVSTGTWRHIVGTGDSSNNLRLYENGSLTAGPTTVTNSPTSTRAVIGADDSAVIGNWWSGSLDEVRISKVVRTADWILTEYNNQSSPTGFCPVSGQQAKTLTVPNVQFKGGVKVK